MRTYGEDVYRLFVFFTRTLCDLIAVAVEFFPVAVWRTS